MEMPSCSCDSESSLEGMCVVPSGVGGQAFPRLLPQGSLREAGGPESPTTQEAQEPQALPFMVLQMVCSLHCEIPKCAPGDVMSQTGKLWWAVFPTACSCVSLIAQIAATILGSQACSPTPPEFSWPLRVRPVSAGALWAYAEHELPFAPGLHQ